ncbi:hypothetical protein [Pantoea sp. A4]|uniref:hypothetical protein n=1 Tax=Pantoea sp. A4 TaxID=1225184 RepID=UPI00035F026E|nr:hypothetical protein [Pantoea sp. A4]
MGVILLLALLACIPATIAKLKGHSFIAWWFYGVFLLVVALIHSLFLRKKPKNPEPVPVDMRGKVN